MLKIIKAVYIQDYKIKVWFNDKDVRIIDLYPFISQSNHPLIRNFLDKQLFKNFRIEYGALCWGNNEFDISPHKIRNGVYDAKEMTANKTK